MEVGLAPGRDAVTQAFIFMQRQFGARRAERRPVGREVVAIGVNRLPRRIARPAGEFGRQDGRRRTGRRNRSGEGRRRRARSERHGENAQSHKIGRESCRERVCQYVSISVVAVALKKKNYILPHIYFYTFYLYSYILF